jgi:hypothetical protein
MDELHLASGCKLGEQVEPPPHHSYKREQLEEFIVTVGKILPREQSMNPLGPTISFFA